MRKLILLTGLLAASAGAHAADNGIYIGASVGRASVEIDDVLTTSTKFDGDDTGYKVIVGIRPLDWLGFEANYVNFGKPEDTLEGTKVRTEGSGLTGFGVGFLALGPVDLLAKVGVISWDTEIASIDRDGTDLAYGVGVQFRLLSLAVRAEYEIFDIGNVDDVNMLSLGVTYTFL